MTNDYKSGILYVQPDVIVLGLYEYIQVTRWTRRYSSETKTLEQWNACSTRCSICVSFCVKSDIE